MKRGIATSVSMLSLIFTASTAQSAGILGSGAHNCAEFLEAYRKDPVGTDAANTQWALGFMSAMNLTVSEKLEFDLTALKLGEMQRWLRKYCAEHPQAEFYEAVDQLMFSLPSKPNRANSAPPDPDVPPATKRLIDEAQKQTASDSKGPRGQYARETCGQKLGISAAVSDGREVARLYGAQKAIAWTDCVVDTLYPDPAKR